MKLIADKIECNNGLVSIKIEYENDESFRIESNDSIKIGVYSSKHHVEWVFDEIIPQINDNCLTFFLDDIIKDYFLMTKIDHMQLFVEVYKDCNEENDNGELSDNRFRCFIKHNKWRKVYFCNFSRVLRLYFSKDGLLSIDAKNNPKVKDDDLLFLDEKQYNIEKDNLTINVPFQDTIIDKCELLINRFSDYNNVYDGIIENYIVRHDAVIENGKIIIDISSMCDESNIIDVWFSIQILFTLKGQHNKTRVLIGSKTSNSGYCLYDYRSRRTIVESVLADKNSRFLKFHSSIGMVFALSENLNMLYPISSVRLIDAQVNDKKIALTINNIKGIGHCKGIVIEDNMGKSVFCECAFLSEETIEVSINPSSIDFNNMVGKCRFFVCFENDKFMWNVPIVAKDSDESLFEDVNVIDERGYICGLNLGLYNEVSISSKKINSFKYENVIKNDQEEIQWNYGVIPKRKGKLYAYVKVCGDRLNIYPNSYFEKDLIEETRIVLLPSKKDNNNYLFVENSEKTNGGYSIRFDEKMADFVFDNKSCRLCFYIKTCFYEYFMPLSGIRKKHKVNMRSYFDRREYFFDSVYTYSVNNIQYVIQPYYSFDGMFSIRCVKSEDMYKGQMSSQVEDVSITEGVMKVCGKCNKLLIGEYSGLCICYRNRTEEDAYKIISNNITITENDENVEFIGYIDLKKMPEGLSNWDIRLVYIVDEKEYFLNLFLNDDLLYKKLCDPYNEDEYLYDDGTVVYPYCTYGNTVALLRREYYDKYDSVEYRLQEAKAIKLYQDKKDYYDSQNIVLFFEKFGTCSDNAYHFFKYCMENECENKINCHIYYIIEKDSVDYKNVCMYKDHLIEYGSLEHQIYILAARLFMTSDTNAHAYIYRAKDSLIIQEMRRKKYIFLEHGVSALKNGSYVYGKGKQGEPTWYIVTSDFQKNFLKKYYKLSDKQLKVTGLARWDALENRAGENKKKILIAPTWRRSLDYVSDEKFYESDFCQRYIELLSSERFIQILEQYDLECDFYMHLKFIDYLDVLKGERASEKINFSSRINICSFGDKPINELYMECSMMVTDYSSVAFDTLWQNKPVVFYQFDISEFNEMWGSMIDMDKDLPGDRVYDVDELLDVIEGYVVNNFTIKKCYEKKANTFFKYVDHSNCERIWKVVESIWREVEYKPSGNNCNQINKEIHPYLIATSEGKVGIKTIIKMIPRWLGYKLRKK